MCVGLRGCGHGLWGGRVGCGRTGFEGEFDDCPKVQFVELCGGILTTLVEELVMLEDANAQIMIEASFEASGCDGVDGDEGVRGGSTIARGPMTGPKSAKWVH